MIWQWLEGDLGYRLTLALLHFLWQGTAVYFVWRIVVRPLIQQDVSWKYAGAITTMFAMIACPLVTFAWIDRPIGSVASAIVPSEEALESGHAFDRLESLQPYLFLVWLTGVCGLGLRICFAYIGTLFIRFKGASPLNVATQQRFREVANYMGLRRIPELASSPRIRQAMTVGILRPMVVIPAAWLTEASPEILEAVLAHELAHIRRHDLWVNLVQRMVEALFFYHPVVWWISTEIRDEREACCDELAIASTGRRLEYAKSLEQVAAWENQIPPVMLGTSFLGDRKMKLLGRVHRILGMPSHREGRMIWPVGIALVLIPAVLWVVTVLFGTMPGSPEAMAHDPNHQPQHTNQLAPGIAFQPPGNHPIPPQFPPPHWGPPPHHQPPGGHGHRPPPRPRPHDSVRADDQALMQVIQELRHEVRMLREQVESLKDHGTRPQPREGFSPQPPGHRPDDGFQPRPHHPPGGFPPPKPHDAFEPRPRPDQHNDLRDHGHDHDDLDHSPAKTKPDEV